MSSFCLQCLGRLLGPRSWEGRFQLARGTRTGAPALAGEGRWLCCSSPPWDQMAQRWILSPSRLCGVPPEPPALSSGLPWLRWHFPVASMATKSPKHSVLAGPSVFTQKDPSLPPITGFPTLGLTLEISSPGGPEPRSCPRQPSATDVPAFPATSRAPGPSGCAEPALLGLPLPKASSGGRGTERAPRPGVAGWPVASQTGSGRVRVHLQASLQTPRLNVMQFSRVTKMSPFDSFQPFKNQTSLAHTRYKAGGSLVWSLGCQRRTPSLPAVGTPGAGLSSLPTSPPGRAPPGALLGTPGQGAPFPHPFFFFFNFLLKRSWHTRVY